MPRAAWMCLLLFGCSSDPAAHCPMRGAIQCATDVGGALSATFTGTTAGKDDGYSGSRCGIGGGVAVEDAAFVWTAPYAGHFRFSTEGSSFDTIVSARQGTCAGREIACNDDISDTVRQSGLALDLDECETITIVIDGHDATSVGEFVLHVGASEASCADGMDDDRDGLVDCADPDCAGPRCEINSGDWPADWAALEMGVLAEVNRVRAQGAICGGVMHDPVGPLMRDVLLEHAARLHSLDMAEQRYFSHDSLDGRTVSDRVAAEGFTSSTVGENIAEGQTTVDEVMTGWMNSTGHCENIMNPAYHTLGVGYAVVEGGDGPRWTQDFGGLP